MGLSSSSDNDQPHILDASVIINLNASARGLQILKATGYDFVVTETVYDELRDGASSGRGDADALQSWITTGIVEKVSIPKAGEDYFEQLVSGDSASTLDDGEAATIAVAIALSGVAVVDEAKANRICANVFPKLVLCSTTDLMLHRSVDAALGREAVNEAIYMALRGARMQIAERNMDTIIDRIGRERTAECTSIPRRRRVFGS